jgi:hypothetical protein
MSAVYSVNGVRIRLTEERWGHIVAGRPGIVQEGDFGELVASRFYEELGERGKYIFTVYREVDTGDGLIMTAYMDERRSDKKVVVWTGP